MPRRREAEEHSRHDRNDAGIGEHARVDGQHGRRWNDLGCSRPEGGRRPHCEQDAARAAHRRDNKAFGDKLSHQAQPARAHGSANRDLAASDRASRQKEVCQVDAGDEKHESDCRKQDDDQRTDVADELFTQRTHEHAEPGVLAVVARILCSQAFGEAIEFGAGLRQGGTRREPGDDLQIMVASVAGLGAIERERDPEVCRTAEAEAIGQDAEDRVRLAIQLDVPADHGRISGHLRFPECVIEQRDVIAARLVLVGREYAPELRPYSEQREQVGRSRGRRDADRFARFPREVGAEAGPVRRHRRT